MQDAAGPGERRTIVYFNATDGLSGQYVALTNRPNAPGQPKLSPLNTAILDRLHGLRIAQAVHMSARFPYLSPSPDLRVPASDASLALFGQTKSADGDLADASLASLVDGGYFDNSGLWPVLRLLDNDRAQSKPPHRVVLHIVNDHRRNCSETPMNKGCIQAEAGLLHQRLDSRGGWLWRPTQAIQAVQSEHSLQSITALGLTQSTVLSRKVPMPDVGAAPEGATWLLDAIQWLPIHGRDATSGRVALGWTLAPDEREFLCLAAAGIRILGVPGVRSAAPVDRSQESASPAK